MKVWSIRIPLLVAALLAVCVPKPARAQAPLEPAQMSPRTLFYLNWRGVPPPDARKANSLLALWDDPDFAPVRSAIAAGMLSSSEEKSTQPKLTSEQIQEYAALLENSFTLGYLSAPTRRSLSNGTVAADAKMPSWHGMYAVSAGEQTVMEDLLSRLDGKVSGAASLAQSAAYQEARANLGSGLIEFFLRIPDLKNLAADSQAGTFQVRPLLDAARLDAVHSLSGHITFEGAKTHVQAAILGDAVPGTPFDIWSAGQPSPVSLTFVPADAVSYTSAQVNFQGIYDTVKRVARAAFPQAQQGNADLLDTLAQQKLGMPVPEALGLLTGEFASMQTSPSMDSAKQIYFLGIRKKPETLKLMRTVFSEQITSERNEGDITFLKVSLGGKQSSAGSAQWNFFNVAVTQDMILGATRVETLREVLANRARTSTAGLATVPQFRAGRAQFPEKLDGLSYLDFQKVDWQALKDRWMEDAKKSSVAKTVNPSKDTVQSTAPDWLAQINPQVFARHLHYSSSVSWKDSKGIHWDQWVESRSDELFSPSARGAALPRRAFRVFF